MSFYAPRENRTPNPDQIIDLHGFTTSEARVIIDELLTETDIYHVRLIVGRGKNSINGPILPNFVKTYLKSKNIYFEQSRTKDGGEGSLEVFFE